MNKKNANIILFLIGLFCWTRVHLVGMIGISELFCAVVGPFFFMQDYARIRRDGFAVFFWLALATCLGCLISSFYNHAVWQQWLRGLATPFVVFAACATIYHYMNRSPDGIRWLFFGWALSGLFTFIVSGGSLAALADDESSFGINSAAVMRMYLLLPLFYIPIMCYFTKTPTAFSVIGMAFMGIHTVMATASGRGQALIVLAGAALLFVGGKSIRKMARIRKGFVFYLILAVVFLGVAKIAYSHAAAQGLLGEESRKKYESQTKEGDSALKLLMSGRAEVFIGFMAALERPIMGYGAWAADTTGIKERYLAKFGTPEDYVNYVQMRQKYGGVSLLDFHSHIAGFWVWYGIIGLIFWLYVLKIVIQYFSRYIDVIPQWFGLMVITIMPFMWNVFFSPFSQRIQTSAMIVAILYIRAVANGRIALPVELLREKSKYNR